MNAKQMGLSSLDGMREIVRHEMLETGIYVSEVIDNPRLEKSGAICGGRKHCAIGSLWIGGGVKYLITFGYQGHPHVKLPGVETYNRDSFLKPRHGLRLAYNALNMAAKEFADSRGINLIHTQYEAEIEALFEGHWDEGEFTKSDLLRVISRAKALIKADKVPTGYRKTTQELNYEARYAA